jgi:hypothetical protein
MFTLISAFSAMSIATVGLTLAASVNAEDLTDQMFATKAATIGKA